MIEAQDPRASGLRPSGAGFWQLRESLLLAMGLLLAAMLVDFGYTLWSDRSDRIREAEKVTQNLAQVIEEQTASMVNAIEFSLSSAERRIERIPAAGHFSTTAVQDVLRDNLRAMPFGSAMFFIDAQGRLLYDSERFPVPALSFAERGFFKQQRDGPALRLVIEAPLPGGSGYDALIGFSRRLSRADGSFAGVAVVGVDPQYLKAFYQKIDVGATGSITLRLRDGRLLARSSNFATTASANLLSRLETSPAIGTYLSTAALDGVPRIVSYRVVPTRPLVVTVGMGRDEVLASWISKAWIYASIACLLVLVVARLAWLVYRELAQRARLSAVLRKSEEDLATTLQSIGDAVVATDATGRVTRLNPVAEQLLGIPRAQALGQPLSALFRIVNAQTRLPVTDPVQRVLAHGMTEAKANDTTLMAQDGREYQIANSAAPIRDAEGRIRGVVLVFSDVTPQYRAQQALRDSENELRTMAEAMPQIVWMARPDGQNIFLSSRWTDYTGLRPEEGHGTGWRDALRPEQQQSVWETWLHDAALGQSHSIEIELRRHDGIYRWWLMRSVPLKDDDGQVVKWVGSATDIHDIKETELALRISAIAFQTEELITISDTQRRIVQVNEAFTRATGFSADEVVGQSVEMLQAQVGSFDAQFYCDRLELLAAERHWQGEAWCPRKNGAPFPIRITITAVLDDAQQVTHYVSLSSDITKDKEAEQNIHQLAFYDPLTQLPNRSLLRDRLRQALARSQRSQRHGALLFLDLDNFKLLNDTRGHSIGDLLLVQVAQRLSNCVRESDTVARLGGDEFILLLSDLSTDAHEAMAQARELGQKTLLMLNQPFALPSFEHHSSASIGIALFSNHGIGVDELLRQADLAMYQAKGAGRNTLRFFDIAMQNALEARVALEADLREGLQRGDMLLHFQPVVHGMGQVTGAEALVRWQHPVRGMVPPGQFIGLAEASGLIVPLGQWVMQTACDQLAAWSRLPAFAHLTLSVNVSAQQFREADFVAKVHAALDASGADPRLLKLELTESLLAHDVEDIIVKMEALKQRGVSFSLDDFGTGYSSLSYLKRLPLSQLKIDQSFVRDVLVDPNDAAIARTIVLLGQSLGLSVVAEGVETDGQRQFLADNGCSHYQGYLFSRPLPIAQFDDYQRRAIAAPSALAS